MYHVPERTRELARRIAVGLVERELEALLAEEASPLARVARQEAPVEEEPGPEAVISYPAPYAALHQEQETKHEEATSGP